MPASPSNGPSASLCTTRRSICCSSPKRLAAPDLLITEVANVAWRKTRRGEIDDRLARDMVDLARRSVPNLYRQIDLVDRALEIAFELAHPVYDCLYLACAEATGGTLVTADRRLLSAVQNTPFAGRVHLLADPAP